MQQDIQALCVGRDGTVYTNSIWDESGAEIAAYRNGDRIAFANNTHGCGASGGDAITANSTYVYAAMSGNVDVELGISATLRSNGEYDILVEDDARAKILMYRWKP
jgi:hypothetical protein